jgi:flavin reductase (DIM6/NTAB) family NADH-FMN oxidoreductase RutF
MHRTIEPTILYFGTPVALISTLNEDGTANIAPMSSAWWLGWSCMLGLGSMGKTSENLIRTRECVINLPSQEQVGHVDRLALTTGKDPVPAKKVGWGYRYEGDKFGVAGLTRMSSIAVLPPRIAECPVQMEGVVHDVRSFGKNVSANAFEVHIVRLHVEESLLVGDESRPHIDADRWRPLIMSFCRFFGMGGEVYPSRLAASDFMKLVSKGAGPQPTIGSHQPSEAEIGAPDADGSCVDPGRARACSGPMS